MVIELPEKITKFLVYCLDPRVTAWKVGQFGIYQESHRPINTIANLKEDAPSIIKVRYTFDDDVTGFLHITDLRIYRIFKTVQYRDNETPPLGFYYHTAKNLLGLYAGTKGENACFRISSDSKIVRDKFYEIAMKINTENSYNHTFDYDKYDVDFTLKVFKDGNRRILVTYLTDLNEEQLSS